MVKCQINQIASLIKVSILKTTNREPIRTVVGFDEGRAASEAEAAGKGAANRTGPIVTVGTDRVERTIVEVAVARHRQFKR